jgi:hypothetical protein
MTLTIEAMFLSANLSALELEESAEQRCFPYRVCSLQNEKKHSLTLLEKTKDVLGKAGKKLSVIADTQYSDKKLKVCWW